MWNTYTKIKVIMLKRKNLKTPILFLIFKRPDTTQRVFNEIRKAKPKKLFVAADGAKNDEEWIKCNDARKIISQVDWNCEVKTLLRDKNLGGPIANSEAITWFFNNVEEGIILEDDCLPNQSFFWFCEELLEKYKKNKKIMCITGDNFQKGKKRGEASYYFSVFNHCWGWATWKRAWKYFDIDIKTYPEFKKQEIIKNTFNNKIAQTYWVNIFDKQYYKKKKHWDYAWTFACLYKKGLTCTPNVNLVSNIGFRDDAAHTIDSGSKLANLKIKNLLFPLTHPEKILVDKSADKFTFFNVFLKKTQIKQIIINFIPYYTRNKYDKIKKILVQKILRKKYNSLYKKYSKFSMIPKNIFIENLALCNKIKNLTGCIVECGVYRGGMIAAMAELLGTKKSYYLFDSFKGLPSAQNIDGQKAKNWQSDKQSPHYFNNCKAEIEFAQKAMEMSGVKKYKLIKGWFSETMSNFKPDNKIAVLRLDGDWYKSTKECLNCLYKYVAKNGIIIIDDYYTWEGCSKAIHDFLSENKLSDRIYQSNNGVCYIIKSN